MPEGVLFATIYKKILVLRVLGRECISRKLKKQLYSALNSIKTGDIVCCWFISEILRELCVRIIVVFVSGCFFFFFFWIHNKALTVLYRRNIYITLSISIG